MSTKTTVQKKKKDNRIQTVYSRSLLTRKIVLPVKTIGKNLQDNIEENIKFTLEGKCCVEGFIKPETVKLITYSCGSIERGNSVIFEVVFECDVCFPIEGMVIPCIAKNITKAGIRCESANDVPSPIVVFIAKDHHYNSTAFNDVKEGDKMNVKVIGQRFELNDRYISIIGELVKEKDFTHQKYTAKQRLVIE